MKIITNSFPLDAICIMITNHHNLHFPLCPVLSSPRCEVLDKGISYFSNTFCRSEASPNNLDSIALQMIVPHSFQRFVCLFRINTSTPICNDCRRDAEISYLLTAFFFISATFLSYSVSRFAPRQWGDLLGIIIYCISRTVSCSRSCRMKFKFEVRVVNFSDSYTTDHQISWTQTRGPGISI